MENVTELNFYNKVPRKGISWRAILAGTIAALSLMLILNLIGLAIGLWSIEPTEESDPLSGLGTGSIIWWVVSNLIVLFVGGLVAARVGVSFTNTSGVIQGIMTWALYTLVSAWLLTSVVGSIISGVGNIFGGIISTTGDVVADQLGPVIKDQFADLEVSLDGAKDEFYSLLEDTNKDKLDPQYLESQARRSVNDAQEGASEMARRPGRRDSTIEEVFGKTKNRFEQSFEAIDKQALVNILVERTGMTEAEAKNTVDNSVAEFERAREEFDAFVQETKEKAKVKAEEIANAVANAAIYLAIALTLGAMAAAFGGFLGVKNLRENYLKHDHMAGKTDPSYYDRGDVV
ncbi:YrzE family protein [Aquiflexum gelatinilyticum]|uniref:CAP-Gly protein n=1 Tax=Aquiflexum gelatinilyticum TaxID=2961943 RepID=A0A9X2P2I2_9BACT|nr:YrzE family protein [Aquiflexum gelatinilyticum]MCR9013702.1 hypothetical protein [Aquiflexum gelatinilyticum]